MYREFYGFSEEPFRLTPDVRFCFRHRSFAKARAYFKYALDRGEGFVLVTGRPGTGKTTLIDDLLAELAQSRLLTVRIESAQIEADDLVRRIAYGFGLDPAGHDKATILYHLERHLEHRTRNGEQALLIVDEAQILSADALEELRLLTNLRPSGRSLLQIFLVGQEALRDLIRSPKLEQLHQRILCACHLDPLPLGDTRDYIAYRLEHAGWSGDPILEALAVHAIHRASQGVPRLINKFMDRLLLHGGLEGLHRLGGADADLVLRELSLELLFEDLGDRGLAEQSAAVVASEIMDIDKPSGIRIDAKLPQDSETDPQISSLMDLLSPALDPSVDVGSGRSGVSLAGEGWSNLDAIFSEPVVPNYVSTDRPSPFDGQARSASSSFEITSDSPVLSFDASPTLPTPPDRAGTGLGGGLRESSGEHPEQERVKYADLDGLGAVIRARRNTSRRGGWIPWLSVSAILAALVIGIVLLSAGGPHSSVSDRLSSLRDGLINRFASIGVGGSSISTISTGERDSGTLQDVGDQDVLVLPEDLNPSTESRFPDATRHHPQSAAEIPELVDGHSASSKADEILPGPQSSESDDHEEPQADLVSTANSVRSPSEPADLSRIISSSPPDGDGESSRREDSGNAKSQEGLAEIETAEEQKPVGSVSVEREGNSVAEADPVGPDEQRVGNLWAGMSDEMRAIGLTPIESGGWISANLRELVSFGSDSFEIPGESITVLDQLADMFNRHDKIRIQVIGHTDDTGGADYNRQLSLRRAEALVKYLSNRVQSPERIEAIGMGKDEPLVASSLGSMTAEQRLRNRRIEVKVAPIQ
jgi:type II secretory pathway predicted ATPase ExeA/outer membrane protein OmpA-like peptidoglycan-associated protein